MPKEKKDAKPAQDGKLDLIKEIKVLSSVLGLDSTPDGKTFFVACMDGGVYRLDRETEKPERLLKHDSYASGVWHLPGSKLLISAGYDGALQWYDLHKGLTVRKVQAHKFWSWQMAVSPNEKLVASVTGQYLAGGYKYEPAAEQEPSLRVYDARTGELKHSLAHVPPTLSVAFSPDSRFLAAANMMGEIRVYDLETGQQAAVCTTPDFTSWGIIKSHHYVGGIFALAFSPDGKDVIVAGMGPMNDPMAGNGKQRWQRFAWKEKKKVGEINEGDGGNGLMETLWYHPSNKAFVMAGKLAQGSWNVAFFDNQSGKMLHSVDTKFRVTDAVFSQDGKQLFLGGAVGQQNKKDGKYPEAGRIKIYKCAVV